MWLAPERLFSARPRDSLTLLSYWQLIWGSIGLFLFSLCWLTNLKQDFFLEHFSLWTQQLVCETQITEWLEKLIIPACRLEWNLVLHRYNENCLLMLFCASACQVWSLSGSYPSNAWCSILNAFLPELRNSSAEVWWSFFDLFSCILSMRNILSL